MKRFPTVFSLTFAVGFVGGVSLACETGSEVNLGHCYYAEGDQTCGDRHGAARGYCVGPDDQCNIDAEYGCVTERPPDECYSPCGRSTLATEDSTCLGTADETETGDEMATGDGDGEPEPVCGDGLAAGDEQCDDGNDVDDDECSNACTAATCGDGIVQSFLGETCDDGNTIAGDTCATSCVLPGTVIWNRLYDFDSCNGYSIALASSGNLAVTAFCVESGWRILGFGPDGELLWDRGTIDFGLRVAIGPSDELAVGGQINGAQGQVRTYDSDGNLAWTKNVPSTVTSFLATAIDGSGGVIVGGASNNDRLLHRYSAEGTLEWGKEEAGGITLLALATNPSGYIWSLRLDPFQIETYSAAGDLDWTSGILGSSTVYGDIAVDLADNVYVVGQTSTEWPSFYLAKFTPLGIPLWTELHDDPGVREIGYGVTVLPTGGAIVSGHTNGDGINLETNGLLSWFSEGGEHLQDVTFDGDENNDADVLRDVAVSADGYAVAVGDHENTSSATLWLLKVAI